MQEIEEAAIEAANERLAHMGIVPATAEDQPEKFRTIDPLQENAHAMLEASKYVVSHDGIPAPPAQSSSTSTPNRSTNAPGLSEPVQPPPTGWHYGTRGASKGKLVRDVAPKSAAAAPKPTAPEPVPTSAPADEPESETIPQRYKRLVDEVYEASRHLRRLRNELECATADLIL